MTLLEKRGHDTDAMFLSLSLSVTQHKPDREENIVTGAGMFEFGAKAETDM